MAIVQIQSPGVYLDDTFRPSTPAFETGVPAFVGRISAKGAMLDLFASGDIVVSIDMAAWSTLEATVGATWAQGYLGFAIRGFFHNGGRRCYVARLDAAGDSLDTALLALDVVDDFDLILAPDMTPPQPSDEGSMADWAKLIQFCDGRTGCHAILDAVINAANVLNPPAGQSLAAGLDESLKKNVSVYAPWIKVRGCPACDSTGYDDQGNVCQSCWGTLQSFIPPSGHVAGVYSRTDALVGVYKAPANEVLQGVIDLQRSIDDATLGRLNEVGVNCLRAFPGRGIRVWGARTLAAKTSDLAFVNTRRTLLTIARWLQQSMETIAFEPNDLRLWIRIGREVGGFLEGWFRRGALVGASANEAYYVKCDSETNPVEVRESGKVVTEVGLALAKPCEFVVVRLVSGGSGTTLGL